MVHLHLSLFERLKDRRTKQCIKNEEDSSILSQSQLAKVCMLESSVYNNSNCWLFSDWLEAHSEFSKSASVTS